MGRPDRLSRSQVLAVRRRAAPPIAAAAIAQSRAIVAGDCHHIIASRAVRSNRFDQFDFIDTSTGRIT